MSFWPNKLQDRAKGRGKTLSMARGVEGDIYSIVQLPADGFAKLTMPVVQSDYRVAELTEHVNQLLNLFSYHSRQLRQAGLVHMRLGFTAFGGPAAHIAGVPSD